MFEVQQNLSKYTKSIAPVLPIEYEFEDIVMAIEKYYSYEWRIINERYREYSRADKKEQVILDTMESIDSEIEEKADGYAKIIRMLTVEVDAIGSEIDRLSARKKSICNHADCLKASLEQSMIFLDKRKFKTALFSFNIQKNPATVNIVGDVPEEYLIPQEPKVDKKAIIAF